MEKLLIIHMDDMGMGYASNEAGKELFEIGVVTSASVMMPCSWAYNFVCWYKENPQYDVGLHFTFTSEWENYRWRSFTGQSELHDEFGFLPKKYQPTMTVEAIKEERAAQVAAAKKWGFDYTHFDMHMYVGFMTEELAEDFLSFVKESKTITNITEGSMYNDRCRELFDELNQPFVKPFKFNPDMTEEEFLSSLDSLEEGLNTLTIHPVIYTPEIADIIPEYEQRVKEYKFFTNKSLKEKIEKKGIKLVSWKDAKNYYNK